MQGRSLAINDRMIYSVEDVRGHGLWTIPSCCVKLAHHKRRRSHVTSYCTLLLPPFLKSPTVVPILKSERTTLTKDPIEIRMFYLFQMGFISSSEHVKSVFNSIFEYHKS